MNIGAPLVLVKLTRERTLILGVLVFLAYVWYLSYLWYGLRLSEGLLG
jgi:hypothetical protein